MNYAFFCEYQGLCCKNKETLNLPSVDYMDGFSCMYSEKCQLLENLNNTRNTEEQNKFFKRLKIYPQLYQIFD
ncbi:MAG TPA: hypothetical protein VJB35_06410 [Candidatus Nanoarchaeia archaeon]|nr:hypothetical protein [Candidatus Nanoarchaeia archaeon]